MHIPGYHEHDLLIKCQFMLVTALADVNVELLENVHFVFTNNRVTKPSCGSKGEAASLHINANLDLNNTQHSWPIEYYKRRRSLYPCLERLTCQS